MLFLFISIHTFLTEGDLVRIQSSKISFDFNPHLPYGRWQSVSDNLLIKSEFQSTPSLRKVTKRSDWFVKKLIFQSTPSLRKVTAEALSFSNWACISIHTFLTEGDLFRFLPPHNQNISIHTFLTEGDYQRGYIRYWSIISIHTFLTEGDTGYHTCRCIFWYFNPHLPYGRWLGDTEMCWHCREFQSTPSLRKVTTVNIAGMHF